MHTIDTPTYAADRCGPIRQWDERDILFARQDLFTRFGADTPQYRAYYEQHPELLAYDAKIAALPGLGQRGGPDVAMFESQFTTIRAVGSEVFTNGAPAAHATASPPARAAEKVKALASFLGADLVGIGPLRQEWVYSHVGRTGGNAPDFQPWGSPIDLRSHRSAVALGFQMDYDLLRCAPHFPTLLATAKGYGRGAWVSIQLAAYLRRLGYAARAHHLNNYQVLCTPVAVDCGLGELSRAGYLLTRQYGLGLRLAVVTTDMPLAHDRPVDIGVQSFCAVCKICAEECPIGAIPPGDKVEFNGVRKWKLDEQKCYRYWRSVGSDCGICMAACPWTRRRTRFHRAMAAVASIAGPHQAIMTQAHRRVYGRFKSAPAPLFIG